jgi:hypothetical protein
MSVNEPESARLVESLAGGFFLADARAGWAGDISLARGDGDAL